MTDHANPIELVKEATGRIATRLGVTFAEIQSSIVDVSGTSMPDANLAQILAHLTDVTDEVRRAGDLYFWYETDSGDDPLGPARTPRPRRDDEAATTEALGRLQTARVSESERLAAGRAFGPLLDRLADAASPPYAPAPAPTITVMHLAECEPEKHTDWEKTTHAAGGGAGGVLCDQTQYMAGELYPDEEVWTERREQQPTPAEQALAALREAFDQAKVHWDHGDAPYDPDLLALFRAAEKVLDAFPTGDEQDPGSLIH